MASTSGPSLPEEDPTTPDAIFPSLHLLSERRTNHDLCLHLYKAAEEGDVVEGRRLIRENPELLNAAITEEYQTVLHVAAGAKQTRFVKEVMEANPNNLRLKDKTNFNPFYYAVMAGSIEIAQIMLYTDLSLLIIRGGERQMTPLFLAVSLGKREMASFLYDYMKREESERVKEELERDKEDIFYGSIDNTIYDLALKLLKDDERNELAIGKYGNDNNLETPLDRLARTPLHLLNQSSKTDNTALLRQALYSVRKGDITASLKQLAFYLLRKSDQTALLEEALELVHDLWKKILDKEDNQVWIYFQENKEFLFDAARLGNYKFLAKLIGLYPDLVCLRDDRGQSIFHIAVMCRHSNLFSLIHEMGFKKQKIANDLDNKGNSILHLAAKYPRKEPVPGAALEMQLVPDAALEMHRELKFYKEVELLVKPSYKEWKNNLGETPPELFTRTHAPLLKQGEDWLRNTAQSCMLVATLIITAVFAAALSVPGGNDQVTGIPIHLRKAVFGIFTIVDAIALSSSMISTLIFWSILISRYEENDFLKKLPDQLWVGFATLFISITSIMVAFGSSFFLAYNEGRLIPIPSLIAILVSLPIIIFVLLQYRLLKILLCSSFCYRFFTKPKKC